MNENILAQTIQSLVGGNKGLLAMDESTGTCNQRFAVLGIPETESARRDWREIIVTSPGLGDYISGAILSDETIRQDRKNGVSMLSTLRDAGILPGIKVDRGTLPLAGHPLEKMTAGLDGLRERLQEYFKMGARFAKWRAVFSIGAAIPDQACIETNAYTLAIYAALCQECSIVPIVEPEVLMEGTHTLTRCFSVTAEVLSTVFQKLYIQNVDLENLLLKPSMVLPGKDCPVSSGIEQVADETIRCFRERVPAATGGVAFLSGGQSGELAAAHLNAMHTRQGSRLPWPLTFSFARAIQQPALSIWRGNPDNQPASQAALLHRAKCSQAARMGLYAPAMETSPA